MSRDPSLRVDVQDARPVSPLKQDHDPYFRQQDLAQKPQAVSKLLEEIRGVYKDKTRGDGSLVKPGERNGAEQPPTFEIVDYHRPEPREDEEEHISAAVYYPHPGPSPEEIERFTSPGEVVSDQQTNRQPRVPAVDTVLSTDKTLDIPRGAEHIDISVVSKNDKKIFHGNYRPLDEIATDLPTPALSPVEEAPTSAVISTSESEFESGDEYGQPSQTDQTDEMSTTPTQPKLLGRKMSEAQAPHTRAKVVLEPYKHQVGGHSTIFRFSRRAVCKQLNNRENEFYERIEQRHPDMLKFLPRYAMHLDPTLSCQHLSCD
jgi:hypothetical protein